QIPPAAANRESRWSDSNRDWQPGARPATDRHTVPANRKRLLPQVRAAAPAICTNSQMFQDRESGTHHLDPPRASQRSKVAAPVRETLHAASQEKPFRRHLRLQHPPRKSCTVLRPSPADGEKFRLNTLHARNSHAGRRLVSEFWGAEGEAGPAQNLRSPSLRLRRPVAGRSSEKILHTFLDGGARLARWCDH